MSIDDKIEQHITDQMAAAYPDIDPDQYVIVMADGQADYTKRKGRDVVGSETLLVDVVVATESKFDRLPFWRAFRRRELNLDGDKVQQTYKGHKYRNYVETAGFKGTAFRLEYVSTIYESSS